MKRKLWQHCGIFLCYAVLLPNCQAFAQMPNPGLVWNVMAAGGDRCDNPGSVLKKTVEISAGGPYVAKAGLPITLHGSYIVAGQTDDSNHLKMIGQALQSYLQANGTYPPAALLNHNGQPVVSWRVLILPYLAEQKLYERFDLKKSWDDPVNLHLLEEMPAVYRKSGAPANTTETGFAGVQGPGSLFQNASAELNGGHKLDLISTVEKIAAGPLGEAVHLPWAAPWDIDISEAAHLGSPYAFSGEGHSFTPLLFLDGTVHLMPNNVDPGSMTLWTHVPDATDLKKGCACTLPGSVDAGLRAVWDLGNDGGGNTSGFDAAFVATKRGEYTVTLHVFDHFGNKYNSSTKVEVR